MERQDRKGTVKNMQEKVYSGDEQRLGIKQRTWVPVPALSGTSRVSLGQ